MTNPNPMNSRCGLEDCDCEYTIGGLLRRLEIIAQEALTTVRWARGCSEPCQCGHTQAKECDSSCLCYVAGSEAERRPLSG
jgi:hypothetical protein